jgi:murein DD-endopeptidase MepM/ murein hydrolase activator NlpD
MKKEHAILGGIAVVGIVITFLIIKKTFGKKIAKSMDMGDWMKPVEGKLTSGFGLRKDPLNPSKTQGHNGQDIAVPMGTPVKAPLAGTIKNTTPTDAGGKQVVMLHDNGWFTGYAHLSEVLVKPGQKVKKGEVIAYSGNSGAHTSGAHLHFTMTDPKGIKVDPKKYVYRA